MNKKMQDYIELISYGLIGLFSASMFVFGALFPKYILVEESFAADKQAVESGFEISEVRTKLLLGEDVENLEITCLSYECLKEIIDEWN